MSNFTYQIPKDKEQLIYDFYAVTNLSGGMLPGFPEPLHSSFRRHEDTLDFIREEIMGQLCDHLIVELKESLFFAVASEFRHIFDSNTADEISSWAQANKIKSFYLRYKDSFQGNYIDKSVWKKYPNDVQDRLIAFSAALSTRVGNGKFFRIAQKAFDELKWASVFGGESWAQIAEAGVSLCKLKQDDEIMKKVAVIDHVYHLQHNTNAVFNKLQSYYKNGHEWLLEGLNFRANLENFYLLIGKCSFGLKPFLYALVHDMYGISNDGFKEMKKNSLKKSVDVVVKWFKDKNIDLVSNETFSDFKQYIVDYEMDDEIFGALMEHIHQFKRIPFIVMDWVVDNLDNMDGRYDIEIETIQTYLFIENGTILSLELMRSILEKYEQGTVIRKLCQGLLSIRKDKYYNFSRQWLAKQIASTNMNYIVSDYITKLFEEHGLIVIPLVDDVEKRMKNDMPDTWLNAILSYLKNSGFRPTSSINKWMRFEMAKEKPNPSLLEGIYQNVSKNFACPESAVEHVVNKFVSEFSKEWVDRFCVELLSDRVRQNEPTWLSVQVMEGLFSPPGFDIPDQILNTIRTLVDGNIENGSNVTGISIIDDVAYTPKFKILVGDLYSFEKTGIISL